MQTFMVYGQKFNFTSEELLKFDLAHINLDSALFELALCADGITEWNADTSVEQNKEQCLKSLTSYFAAVEVTAQLLKKDGVV